MKRLVIATSLAVLASCGVQDRNGLPGGPADLRVVDAAMASGMPQTAITVTREILQGDPRNIGALLRQGDALVAMGQADAAAECFQRVIEIDPLSLDGLRGLGRVRLAMGQASGAETAFRKALERAPDDAPCSAIWVWRSICRIDTTKRRPPIRRRWRGGRG